MEVLRLNLSITKIVDPVSLVRMRLVKVLGHRRDIISIHDLNFAAGRETHGQYAVSDVADVEVVATVIQSIALAGH